MLERSKAFGWACSFSLSLSRVEANGEPWKKSKFTVIVISFTNNSTRVHTKIRLCTSNPQQNPTISPRMVVTWQTKSILYQNLWNFAILSAILFWISIRLKKLTQVPPYVVCTQERRQVHKQITKRRYRGEKPGRFVFGKTVLFTLCLGLTTPYSMGILVWNFYHTFVTVSTEFWLRFQPQIRPTRLATKFFLHHRQSRKEGSFVCETVWFFRGSILIRLTWNLTHFVPNSVEILTRNFRKKTISGEFFKILCSPRLSST